MTNVTGQNGETKADLRPPKATHNEPSRVERLLSSVLLYAVGLDCRRGSSRWMGCLEFGSAQTGSCCGGKTTAFTSCGCGKTTTATIGTRTPEPSQ